MFNILRQHHQRWGALAYCGQIVPEFLLLKASKASIQHCKCLVCDLGNSETFPFHTSCLPQLPSALTTPAVLQKLAPTQGLWTLDMYGECTDGSLTSKEENHGMAECPPTIDGDTLNMANAPY